MQIGHNRMSKEAIADGIRHIEALNERKKNLQEDIAEATKRLTDGGVDGEVLKAILKERKSPQCSFDFEKELGKDVLRRTMGMPTLLDAAHSEAEKAGAGDVDSVTVTDDDAAQASDEAEAKAAQPDPVTDATKPSSLSELRDALGKAMKDEADEVAKFDAHVVDLRASYDGDDKEMKKNPLYKAAAKRVREANAAHKAALKAFNDCPADEEKAESAVDSDNAYDDGKPDEAASSDDVAKYPDHATLEGGF